MDHRQGPICRRRVGPCRPVARANCCPARRFRDTGSPGSSRFNRSARGRVQRECILTYGDPDRACPAAPVARRGSTATLRTLRSLHLGGVGLGPALRVRLALRIRRCRQSIVKESLSSGTALLAMEWAEIRRVEPPRRPDQRGDTHIHVDLFSPVLSRRPGPEQWPIWPSFDVSWPRPSGRPASRPLCGRACPSPWPIDRGTWWPVRSIARAPRGTGC